MAFLYSKENTKEHLHQTNPSLRQHSPNRILYTTYIPIQDFASHQNEDFALDIENAGLSLKMKLIEISEIGSPKPQEKRRAFSLVFLGPSDYLLNQQIYRLTHPKMGELNLFLVPIGPNQEGLQYEAVFN